MTPDALANLRTELPGCELALYADFESGTVLSSDGLLRYPQEYLDALCECAAQLFGQGDAELEHAIFQSSTGVRGFFRASNAPNEAFCCICEPGVDASKLLRDVPAALGDGGSGS